MNPPLPLARRALAVAALAAVSALTLAACAAGAAPTDASSSAEPGGTLRIAIDSDPVCLDPAQSSLIASGVIGRQLVDSLVQQDPDTGEFLPWLAESWTVSDDGSSYDFVLREGVTFSDGTPLTSDAVRQFFDSVVAEPGKTATGAAFLSGYTGTDVVDDTRFTVRFDSPNAAFLAGAGSRALGILAPATVEASFEERCLGPALVGTGPFVFDDYVAGESVRITSRDDYDWAPEGAAHEGRAHLDAVEYSVSAEASVRTGALQSGQVDVATTIQSQDEPLLERAGIPVLSRINPGVVTAIAPNLAGSQILRDDVVRQAIQSAIDRQEIAEVVLSPSYGVASGVLGETTPGYLDLSDELVPDPDAAAEALDEAGWTLGDDGIRTKDGQSLTLSVLYFYQPNVYEYLQQQLRAVGIDLQLQQVTAAEFTAAVAEGDYDLRQSSFSRPDPDILRTVFGLSLNNSAFLDAGDPDAAELDALLELQRTQTDPAARLETVADAQRLLIEHDWVFPLAQLVQVVGADEKVSGLAFDAFSIITLYDVSLAS